MSAAVVKDPNIWNAHRCFNMFLGLILCHLSGTFVPLEHCSEIFLQCQESYLGLQCDKGQSHLSQIQLPCSFLKMLNLIIPPTSSKVVMEPLASRDKLKNYSVGQPY